MQRQTDEDRQTARWMHRYRVATVTHTYTHTHKMTDESINELTSVSTLVVDACITRAGKHIIMG